MTFYKLIGMLIASLFLAACSSVEEIDSLTSEEVKEKVNQYAEWNVEGEVASIDSENLIISNEDGEERKVSLPDDDFFVSFSPYVNETHP